MKMKKIVGSVCFGSFLAICTTGMAPPPDPVPGTNPYVPLDPPLLGTFTVETDLDVVPIGNPGYAYLQDDQSYWVGWDAPAPLDEEDCVVVLVSDAPGGYVYVACDVENAYYCDGSNFWVNDGWLSCLESVLDVCPDFPPTSPGSAAGCNRATIERRLISPFAQPTEAGGQATRTFNENFDGD